MKERDHSLILTSVQADAHSKLLADWRDTCTAIYSHASGRPTLIREYKVKSRNRGNVESLTRET